MKSQTLLPLIDFLLLAIMWLIRTRSESALTVVRVVNWKLMGHSGVIIQQKKNRLTQSHIIAEKKTPLLKNKCNLPKWNHFFNPFPFWSMFYFFTVLNNYQNFGIKAPPLPSYGWLSINTIGQCTVDELAGMSTYACSSRPIVAWHIGQFMFDMWGDINQSICQPPDGWHVNHASAKCRPIANQSTYWSLGH